MTTSSTSRFIDLSNASNLVPTVLAALFALAAALAAPSTPSHSPAAPRVPGGRRLVSTSAISPVGLHAPLSLLD
jgi:hypothetical protein